jgi:DNA-binding XRE family transcriptional regulator
MAQSKEQSIVLKSFGANVRRLRVQAELTQSRLAELAEVELRTEQKWERGEINPPLTTLTRASVSSHFLKFSSKTCRKSPLLSTSLKSEN